MRSGLTVHIDQTTCTRHWHLTLAEDEIVAWDRERLDMIEDAMWLIRQALAGNTEGPLTLPRTGLPVRT